MKGDTVRGTYGWQAGPCGADWCHTAAGHHIHAEPDRRGSVGWCADWPALFDALRGDGVHGLGQVFGGPETYGHVGVRVDRSTNNERAMT